MRRVKNAFPVPAQAVSSGALTPLGLCPRHGLPAVRTKKRSYYTATPTWLYLLVLVSLLIAVLILLAVRKTVAGPVPDCATCVADQKRRRAIVLGSWGLALVVLIGGMAANSGAVAAIGFFGLIAALLATFAVPQKWQQGQVTKDGYWVELKDPAPAFREAATRAMAAAQPPTAYSPGVTDAR